MKDYNVGAGILNIITESLYDNPIVVFREYVQNSIDSILKNEINREKCEIRMWLDNATLFFLDNGMGIEESKFKDKMIDIGASSKKKQSNLGYKGIGRLSGVPYCKKLIFVNIINYAQKIVQTYTIDSEKYEEIKNNESYTSLSFGELMDRIGCYGESAVIGSLDLLSEIQKYDDLLQVNNSGFLVMLNDISMVLDKIVNGDDFLQQLGWLLPVNFCDELYELKKGELKIGELFEEMTEEDDNGVVPAQYCNIYYNDDKILRPIKEEMLREYVCKCDFKYAVGFHTFNSDRIVIDKNNIFSGIKIYIDNMLLCDEKELIQNLENYGLLEHTSNGQLQSVRGIAAMIYITDKVGISANARRTFIEVTDSASIDFLKMLAEFVNKIYETRYALSNYVSAKKKQQVGEEKLKELRTKALENLQDLAKENIELTIEDGDEENDFNNMSVTEKKRYLKKKISTQLDSKVKEYILQLDSLEFSDAYEKFIRWLEKGNTP